MSFKTQLKNRAKAALSVASIAEIAAIGAGLGAMVGVVSSTMETPKVAPTMDVCYPYLRLDPEVRYALGDLWIFAENLMLSRESVVRLCSHFQDLLVMQYAAKYRPDTRDMDVSLPFKVWNKQQEVKRYIGDLWGALPVGIGTREEASRLLQELFEASGDIYQDVRVAHKNALVGINDV